MSDDKIVSFFDRARYKGVPYHKAMEIAQKKTGRSAADIDEVLCRADEQEAYG